MEEKNVKRRHSGIENLDIQNVDSTSEVSTKKAKIDDISEPRAPLQECDLNTDPQLYLEGLTDLDDLFDDSCDFPSDGTNDANFSLDITSWKRCKVLSISKQELSTILTVEEVTTGKLGKCILKPPWISCEIQIEDIVSLIANFDSIDKIHTITSEHGFLVTNPDTLISGTSVVGALYCQRKAILQDRFRSFDSDNKIMTIGTIVHEVLQLVLREKAATLADITRIGQKFVKSGEVANMLYSCDMSTEDVNKEITPFYPKIFDFVERYIVNENRKSVQAALDVQIYDIKDIEENIWCHQLGLKGKIDVTVNAKCGSDNQVHVMPLELKTGRASFSAEHKGQLALYEMMMNVVGHNVNKGILLYLREGKCTSMSSNRNMKRDLIMLRNEVAYFLSRIYRNIEASNLVPELPEPINSTRICGTCPYSIICSTYLKYENRSIPENHAIKLIADESLKHLSNSHLDYFIRWAGLIYLENEEPREGTQLSHMWTKTPEARSKKGRAAINLRLTGCVLKVHEEYFHTFAIKTNANDLSVSLEVPPEHHLSALFDNDEYLICSTNNRTAVAAGRVVSVGKTEVTMSLERDLSQNYGSELFHLDKYDSQTQMVFNLTNISVLLEDTARAATLRNIIIDREKAIFARTIPALATDAAKQILRDLNKHQKIAVLTAIGTRNYCLFKGLPGTGKTQTVVSLIRMLVALNKSVLITSNTHSAVDNVLKRLATHNIEFLRLGPACRVDPTLKRFTEDVLADNCTTPEELQNVYQKFRVVGVTCLGAAHPLLTKTKFDFCIVDEATQVFQSSVIRALYAADKFILIGDPNQLPPVVKSHKARNLGADESLFLRLDVDESCCTLPTQYRMNKYIAKLANDFAYSKRLVCANEVIATASIKLPNMQEIRNKHAMEKWLLRVTATQLELSVVLIDTLNTFNGSRSYNKGRRSAHSYSSNDSEGEIPKKALYENYCEVAVIVYTIMTLLEGGLLGSSIGIIAPFKAQVELLRYYFNLLKIFYKNQHESYKVDDTDIEINTVDQYQGRDKEVIFYSCTTSRNPNLIDDDSASGYGILEDTRRLTVAITRAKKKLIVIGDVASLERFTPFHKLFECIPKINKISLQQKMHGFEWSAVFNALDALHDCE